MQRGWLLQYVLNKQNIPSKLTCSLLSVGPVTGLAATPDLPLKAIEDWWTLLQIESYEKALAPPQSARGKKSVVKKEEPPVDHIWRAPTLALYSKLLGTIPPNPVTIKAKSSTPPSSSVRTTRSRYNSPAAAVQSKASLHTPHDVPSLKTEPARAETPVASPLNEKVVQTESFPLATPLIRFTFKAGEKKPAQPDFAAGNYGGATADFISRREGDSSGSE